MQLRALVLALAATLLAAPASVSGADIDPNDKGEPLFPDGHPNITYLTDKNWDEHMAKTDKPWLVDFYHPFCPHCKHFAPAFFELAAYYKEKDNIYVGALSCMDHVKCRRVGITGFPTLMTLNFDKKNPKVENKRIIGTHTVQEVKDYVDGVFMEAAINESGTEPPNYKKEKEAKAAADSKAKEPVETEVAKTEEATPVAIWEESTLPMNQTTRLQDAASAFIFGLKQGMFMGSDVMEDAEFDALKGWLQMVSEAFPGVINRKLIKQLYEEVQGKALLDFDTWDAIINEWQKGSVAAFKAEEARYDFTGVKVPEWQRMNDLFLGQGATYRACALYTCGQWTMFHMLTMNPPETGARSGELLVSVAASIRRFMKHFFGCVNCAEHFLMENTVEVVKKISDAEDKPLALRRWLWDTHNSVNKRLHHPLWPKPDICPTCGGEGSWEPVEVDKWLGKAYGFRDAVVPLVTEAATAPMKTSVALRREDQDAEAATATEGETTEGEAAEEAAAVEEAQTEAKNKNPKAVEPKGGDEYRPKDAELGIKNAANTKELVADTKTEPRDGLQGVSAPPVSLFAWYILPVAAVGGYLLFVRSRAAKHKPFRQQPRK